MSAREVLAAIRAAGGDLVVVAGGIRYQGPRDGLTDELRQAIRASKAELIALLAQAATPVRLKRTAALHWFIWDSETDTWQPVSPGQASDLDPLGTWLHLPAPERLDPPRDAAPTAEDLGELARRMRGYLEHGRTALAGAAASHPGRAQAEHRLRERATALEQVEALMRGLCGGGYEVATARSWSPGYLPGGGRHARACGCNECRPGSVERALARPAAELAPDLEVQP